MEIILRRIKQGNLTDETWSLTQKKRYTVGRKRDCDIRLYSKLVSRKHCLFHHTNDGIFVEVLKSSAGLQINTVSPATGAMVQLNNSDIIIIGHEFTYELQFQTLPKLENPEFPEFQFSSNPDLTGYGINFIKRELEEDASDDQQPKKAAKLTTSETCSEALARSPIVDESQNDLMDISPGVSPLITFEMLFKTEEQDTKSSLLPLLDQEKSWPTLDRQSSLESRLQDFQPVFERAFGDSIPSSQATSTLDNRIKNIGPLIEKMLHESSSKIEFPNFALQPVIKTETSDYPSELDISNIPIESGPENEIPEMELKPLIQPPVKIENPDIPATNLTFFANKTPERNFVNQNLPSENSELPSSASQEVFLNQSCLLEKSNLLSRLETPDHPTESGPQNEIPEIELNPLIQPLVKIENPDIPATNSTLFANKTPESDFINQNLPSENSELPSSASQEVFLNQSCLLENSKFPSRPETPDLDEGMQIEIEEETKPELPFLQTDFSDDLNLERKIERICNSTKEIKTENTSSSREAPLLKIRTDLGIRNNSGSVLPPIEKHLQPADEPQPHTSDNFHSLLDQSNSRFRIKEKIPEPVDAPEIEIIPVEVSSLETIIKEKNTDFEPLAEVAIIGERKPHKRRRRRRSRDNLGINDFGFKIKEEPQTDQIYINKPIKEEKADSLIHNPPSLGIENGLNNVERAVKEEKSEHVIKPLIEIQPSVNSANFSESVVDNIEFHEEKSGPSPYENLNKSYENNSESLARKRISSETIDSSLLTSKRIKKESGNERFSSDSGSSSSNSESSDEGSVDSDATTDTESTNVVAKKKVEAENVPEISASSHKSSSSSKLKFCEENLQICKDREENQILQKAESLKRPENRRLEKAKELKKGESAVRSKVVISKKVQNVPYRHSHSDKDRKVVNFKDSDNERKSEEKDRSKEKSKDRGKKEREEERKRHKEKERYRKEESTNKRKEKIHKEMNNEVKSKEEKKDHKETNYKEGKHRKREEAKDKRKPDEQKDKRSHKEKERNEIKDNHKRKETSKSKESRKPEERPKKINSNLSRRSDSQEGSSSKENYKPPEKKEKTISIDKMNRNYVGAKVLDDEDLSEERGRSFDVRGRPKSVKFNGRGKESEDQGTGPTGVKKKLNLLEYKRRLANSGEPQPFTSNRGSSWDQNVSSRGLEAELSAPSSSDARSQLNPREPHTLLKNRRLLQDQDFCPLGLDNQLFGPSTSDLRNRNFRDPIISPKAEENIRASQSLDPRKKSGSEEPQPFINSMASSWDQNVSSRGLEAKLPAPSSSDSRNQLIPREPHPLLKNRRLLQDQDFCPLGLDNQLFGPNTSDLRNRNFRDQIISPKAEENIRASQSLDPRKQSRSEEPQPFINSMASSWNQDVSSRGLEGLEAEFPAPSSSDPRNQLNPREPHPLINNRRLPQDQVFRPVGLDNHIFGPSTSDLRNRNCGDQIVSPEAHKNIRKSKSLDPRTQSRSGDPQTFVNNRGSSRDQNKESEFNLPGPSSSDPRNQLKPRERQLINNRRLSKDQDNQDSRSSSSGPRNDSRNQIIIPKTRVNVVRNSASVDPRMQNRTSESEPQPSTSRAEPREKLSDESKQISSALNDQLLFEIFTWGPEVFLNMHKKDVLLKRLGKIEKMSLNFANYVHYCKVIFNILCLDVSSRIEIGFMLKGEDKKYDQCFILPDVIPKIQIKGTEDENSYLIPFYLRISVPNSEDFTPPHAGDLLQIEIMNENIRTLMVFGYIHRIESRGPSDQPRKLITYLVTIKDKRFNIYTSQITEVWNISNLKSAMECASAVSQLKDSPLLPSIILPNLNISSEGPRRLLSRDDLVFPEPALDKVQLKAISKITEAVANPEPRLCLIEGSPGTGKTSLIYHTILKLLWKPKIKIKTEKGEEEVKVKDEKMLDDRPKILVCTSSNVEFEEIIVKLLDVHAPDNGINMVHVTHNEEPSNRIKTLSLEYLVTKYITKQQTKYHQIEGRKPIEEQAHVYKEGMDKLNMQYELTGCKFTGLKMTVFKVFFQAVNNNNITVRDLTRQQMQPLYDIGNVAHLMGANLIFCNIANLTNHEAMEQLSRQKTISLCIVDEAAQVLEFEALKILSFGVKTLVMLGDQEKRPMANISKELQNLRAGSSLFSRLTKNFSRGKRNPVMKLQTQYRIAMEIERWLIQSRIFVMDTSSNAVELRVPFPLYALRIFNLSYTENFIDNEAVFSSRIIQCIASFGDLRRLERNISVGVIISNIEAKERVEQEIQNAMELVPAGRAQIFKIETNTIDGFLNHEKDIILASCLRNRELITPEGFQRFYSTVTRAKHCLIIFGRFVKVSKIKRNCDWHQLIDYARDVVNVSTYVEYTELRRSLIR